MVSFNDVYIDYYVLQLVILKLRRCLIEFIC